MNSIRAPCDVRYIQESTSLIEASVVCDQNVMKLKNRVNENKLLYQNYIAATSPVYASLAIVFSIIF